MTIIVLKTGETDVLLQLPEGVEAASSKVGGIQSNAGGIENHSPWRSTRFFTPNPIPKFRLLLPTKK